MFIYSYIHTYMSKKKSMACFCTPMSLRRICFSFYKVRKAYWLSHIAMWQIPQKWKRQRGLSFRDLLVVEKAGRTYITFCCGNPVCDVWSSRVPALAVYTPSWQRTGLEKWTKRSNYVQCFGIADLIPFDVFYIWQTFTFASQRTQSYSRHTH